MIKIIEVKFPHDKNVNAKIGDMLIKTDQSIKEGGRGEHPEPFDLFLASLATCSGIYALEFCTKRNLLTEGLSLKIDCVWDPDMRMFNRFDMQLYLPANFPPKYKSAIIKAVELCSVKKHLNSAIQFNLILK